MARPTQKTLNLREARAYAFRVLLKGKPRTISGVEGMKDGLFFLPRHPTNVQYLAQNRSTTYASGVHERRSDQQGVDPPTISLTLDFGERGGYDALTQKGLDGRAATRALENLIRGYIKAVATSGRRRAPLHELEFHDIYRREAWIVEPQNVPYGTEDSARPYSESITLRLLALRRADHAIAPANPLPQQMRNKYTFCPLHPNCKYGGASRKGCPFND